MNYICKVFTPEFKERVENHVQQEAKSRVVSEREAKGLVIDGNTRLPFMIAFKELEARSSLNLMWNNPSEWEKYPEAVEYYKELGVWEPEYTEITLPAEERGLQSQPRVMWNGEIKKIDEIDDMFSFKRDSSPINLQS